MSADHSESVLAPFGAPSGGFVRRAPPAAEQNGPAKAPVQFDARRSEATRYLLAAAHNDGAFRGEFLRRVEVDESLRALSPEVGVDRDMVVEECRQVRRRKAIRNLLLLACWVPLLAGGFLSDLAAYPEFWTEVASEHEGAIGLSIALAALVVLGERVLDHFALRDRLLPTGFSSLPLRGQAREAGNVVVYSDFSPFVGAGTNLGGWSFTVNLGRAKDDSRPTKDFAVSELYDRLEWSLRGLHLPNLALDDTLFVEGRSIRGDRTFLPSIHGPPVTKVGRDVVDRYREHPTACVRHYLCLEVRDWSGEIVVSVFLRFQKAGSKMFCESNTFLLPPLKEACHHLDARYPGVRLADIAGAVAAAPLLSVPLLLAAPFMAAANALRWPVRFFERRAMRKLARFNPGFDYGAGQSMREKQAGNSYRVYFQRLDKEMHVKIIEQHVIDFLAEFLAARNVDTSELRAKGETIMNFGVIISGGSVRAGSVAVGKGASAVSGRGAEAGASAGAAG